MTLKAFKQHMLHFQTIYDYHMYASKLKFKRYTAKQQALSEMCKMLDDDKSQKYKNKRKQKKTKIFAFRAANFSSSLKGNRAAPTKRFKSALESYALANKHYFIEIDEYLTSQICNICGTRTLEEHLESHDKKETLHAILRCTKCCQVFNHDVNASINIRDEYIHMALNDDSGPQIFQHEQK
ncbi:hypothetical protein MBANPS3_010811 [Mucor bainieri]